MKIRARFNFLVSPSAIILCAAPFVFGACVPELSGSEGNLALSYDKGPVMGAQGSSPLAVGAKLGYTANEEGEKPEETLQVHAALSSDDSVIAVDEVASKLITLEALNPGEVTLDVEADTQHSERVKDSFALSAKEVDAVSVEHLCGPNDDQDPVYMIEQDIRLKYTMRAEGDIAVGYGYYPVEVKPADAAALEAETKMGFLALRTGSDTGVASVHSTLEEEEKSSFEFGLVSAEQIVGLDLLEREALGAQELSPSLGETLVLHLLPRANYNQSERPVCQFSGEVQVSVDTPEVCEVSFGEKESGEGVQDFAPLLQLFDTHGLAIRGKAVGECAFSLNIPEANAGEGAGLDYSLEIVGESDDEA